ncbi:hypothetical protein ACRYCC_08275 [Actinomadura scrupuli]|uniref:hypothetical protein n=1 Tax=Actinomadura scrupuli TaxID=559629 RepID=UPI003D9620A4
MDISATSSLAAVIISTIALFVSGVLAVRQVSMMRHANQMPVLVDLMQEFRSAEFQMAEGYVLNKLSAENDVSLGCSGLTGPPSLAVNLVNSFFLSLGTLVAQDMVDEATVVLLFGFRADRAWKALESRIMREREIRNDPFFAVPFEDLVCRIRDGWPPTDRYRLKFRSLSR